ncbi:MULTISPECIES: hypothetical protein [unclassified Sulfitobacter]|uniref:hypothetical protein n=1 Tax=unclassified Sulfitobacter TaxID=196795 RepID=UPI0023E2F4C7|nr:hypothetical protein [Sulfitobacter sp. Ks41]MDF3363076.1 hypothetical protein [Sulfitobacter sp. Ks41]
MRQIKVEAEPIARLLGSDRKRTVGWVYLWNSSELSVLWLDEQAAAKSIEPLLHPEGLIAAKASIPVDVAEFLEALSTGAGDTQNSSS